MHPTITLQLKPITTPKPRPVLDAAADVARRIGCHVEIEVNGAIVRISPTAGVDGATEGEETGSP